MSGHVHTSWDSSSLTLLSFTVALMLTRGGETQPNRTQERFNS